MRIEILCTGDEVLTGKIVNTNFSYMAQKLEDVGLSVHWGTTVGDDRESLLTAFKLAGERADAVIVNGGLGPTVDDLSQEIAAQAAGVELVLHEEWLAKMESFFSRRARTMPPNNRKQAMLPATAEMIDNPVGTACGFAMDIGKARFSSPRVPRELRRMLEEQVIPRLLARSGAPASIHLKRFHSYGIGESHADQLLTGVETLDPQGGVKLGFRAHYPQLETKLTVRGTDMDDVARKLAPITEEVKKRLGNFIIAEDDQTLEGVVLAALAAKQSTLSVVETFTAGQIAARIAPLPTAETVFRRGIVVRDFTELRNVFDLPSVRLGGEMTEETTIAVAKAAREQTGATHALVVLIELDEGADRMDFGGTIWIGIATETGVDFRRSRILGGRDWVRLGAVELGMDCLRRQLQGLPVVEQIDFEKDLIVREIDSGYAWFRLAISVLLSAVGGVGIWSVVVALPAYRPSLASREAAPPPYTLTTIGFAIGGMVMGKLSDRFGIVLPILFGSVALGSGYMLASIATDISQFALASGLLIGMCGAASTFVPLMADISRWFERRRGIAVALCASGNYVAGAFWPPVVEYLICTIGWRSAHFWIGLSCVVLMVPLTLLLRAPAPIRAANAPALSSPFPRATNLSRGTLQVLLAIAGLSCCVAMSMPQVHIVAYCGDLGYGVANGARMLSLMLGFGIVSRIASGFVADRLGGLATLAISSAAQMTALSLYLTSDGLVSLYVISAMFGLFQGGLVPSYAIVIRENFPASRAGTRVGFVIGTTLLGMALGGWMSGAIFDLTGSYRAAFANGVAWNALNFAISLFLLSRGRRRSVLRPA